MLVGSLIIMGQGYNVLPSASEEIMLIAVANETITWCFIMSDGMKL